MIKFLVIGNPIKHSLSPKLHNYWMTNNNIKGNYQKKEVDNEKLESSILEIKKKKILGINVTIPFKKKVIPYLDKLSDGAKKTQSVNTIYLDNNKLIGHNTDIGGFELAIKYKKFDVSNKKIFILGAGGVAPSIIAALYNMRANDITISNRTTEKAEKLKNLFKTLKVVNWGDIPDFDMVINSTSVGLNINDQINLDFSKTGKNRFYYDLIYNPKETNFLKSAKKFGNITENGKMMFIYQAAEAFKIWHGIWPKIDDDLIKVLS